MIQLRHRVQYRPAPAESKAGFSLQASSCLARRSHEFRAALNLQTHLRSHPCCGSSYLQSALYLLPVDAIVVHRFVCPYWSKATFVAEWLHIPSWLSGFISLRLGNGFISLRRGIHLDSSGLYLPSGLTSASIGIHLDSSGLMGFAASLFWTEIILLEISFWKILSSESL